MSSSAQPKQHHFPAQLSILLAVIALIVATTALLPHVVPDFSAPGHAFYWKEGAWHAAPPLPGTPAEIRISPAGTVWAATTSRTGISRFDGARWTSYTGADFGTSLSWLRGGFALRGEEVWGATQDGVIRFDGRQWQLYRDALRTRQPVSVAAGTSGVWVIDRKGNLSHFDGSRWTIESLAPSLSGTLWLSEGQLWLVSNGAWRRKGNTWEQVLPGIRWIGEDAERLWLLDGGAIEALNAAGVIVARFSREGATVYRVAAQGDRVYIVTSTGIKTRGQTESSPYPAPVSLAAVAPDGTLWVAGGQPKRPGITAILPMLALALGSALAMGLLIRAWLRGMARESSKSREAVEKALGQQPKALAWKIPPAAKAGVILLFVAALALLWLIHRLWPDAPSWVFVPIILAVGALASAAATRLRPTKAAAEPTPTPRPQPKSWQRRLWGAVQLLLIPLLWWIFEQGLGRVFKDVARWLKNPAVFTLVMLVVCLIVFGGIFALTRLGPWLLAYRALRRGHYERALWWTRFLGSESLDMRASILLLAGRPKEAEEVYRDYLTGIGGTNGTLTALALSELATALMDQGRYDEARQKLDLALRLDDSGGSVKNDLAELYLLQGREAAQALDLIDQAIALKRASALKKRIDRHQYAVRMANKAWALALLQRRAESEEVLRLALDQADRRFLPVLAGVHWRAGRVRLLLGQHDRAMEDFRRARDLDPRGRYGRRAELELAEHSVWGTRR